jgi:hypothetical protein
VAPLEMNAGTCWGKNTIGPRGRSVEKAPGSDFAFLFNKVQFKPTIKTPTFSGIAVLSLYSSCLRIPEVGILVQKHVITVMN